MKKNGILLIIIVLIPFSIQLFASEQNILNNPNGLYMFKEIIDPNFEVSSEELTRLLFLAISREEEKIVKLLLEKKADPNIAYKDYNLLNVAINKNNPDIVKMLLDAGANPNTNNNPLDVAVYNNTTILEMLLNAGANPNTIKNDILGNTILHRTILKNKPEIVQILLNAKANPNAQNNAEETPLHLAVKNNNPKMVQMLLKAGANPNIQNESGKTSLHFAAEKNNLEIVQMLLNAGADKSIKTKTVVWGFDPSLEIALEEYISPKTAFEIAQETPNINPKIIKLLQNSSWFSWLK